MQDLLEVSAGLARTHAFTAHELAQLIRRVAELRQQPIGRLARWAKMVLVSASMPLEKCNLNPTLLLKSLLSGTLCWSLELCFTSRYCSSMLMFAASAGFCFHEI